MKKDDLHHPAGSASQSEVSVVRSESTKGPHPAQYQPQARSPQYAGYHPAAIGTTSRPRISSGVIGSGPAVMTWATVNPKSLSRFS